MLVTYVRERMPLGMFVPLATAIALAGRAGAARSPVLTLAVDAAVVMLLLAQFRLWDDLADRQHDGVAHPTRALVLASSDQSFRVICAALGVLNAGLLWLACPNRAGLAIFLALNLGMALWYASRGSRSSLGDHLLLAKYPLFVLIVAYGREIDRPLLVGCAAGAVYLAACLYEAIHDPASPARRHRPLIACEALLLVAVASAAVAIGAFS
jgi:4-hydroxybenzoate polyprenyltransferase